MNRNSNRTGGIFLYFSISLEINAAEIQAMVDYDDGFLYVHDPNHVLTETDDGKILYYQTAKDSRKIKNGKYSAIADGNSSFSEYTGRNGYIMEKFDMMDKFYGDRLYIYDISNLIGKETYLSVSPNGTMETATGMALAAAPKIKAKYSIKDKDIIFSGDIEGTVSNYNYSSLADPSIIIKYKLGKYGAYDKTGSLKDIIKGVQSIGTTIYISVAKAIWFIPKGYENFYDETTGIGRKIVPITPFSNEIKIKISARAKEPKSGIKLDLKKAFSWKIPKTQEYKIESKSINNKEWIKGNGNADSWYEIIKKAADENIAAKIVTGDAITEDITIKLRTSETKNKIASNINRIKLSKSFDSPTMAAIEIKIVSKTGKKEDDVLIKAKEDIQYSIDKGLKWVSLEKGKSKNMKKSALNNGLYIRYPGDTAKLIVPSLTTKYTVNNTIITESSFIYDNEGNIKCFNNTINSI